MSFTKETMGDILVIKINVKRATVAEADEFRTILLRYIECGWRKIIINLEDTSFLDSTFLGSILIALRTVSRLGGDLRISGAQGDAQNILEITGAFRVLASFKTVEEAVAGFAGKKSFV